MPLWLHAGACRCLCPPRGQRWTCALRRANSRRTRRWPHVRNLRAVDYQPREPNEVPDREARIFGMSGYMLGKRPLLRLPRPRLGLGLVVAFVDDNAQPFARAHATLPYALSHDLAAARGR